MSPAHTADASGPDAAPTVTGFAAEERHGVTVLRYDAGPHPRALTCTAGALRAALVRSGGAPASAAVVLAPLGTDDRRLDALVTRAGHGVRGAWVTAPPVTDAVKRVMGDRVVATVDRGPLRYLTGPAVVERALLDALASGPAGAVVAPLAVSPLHELEDQA